LGAELLASCSKTPQVTTGHHGPLNAADVMILALSEGTGTEKDFELEGGEGLTNDRLAFWRVVFEM